MVSTDQVDPSCFYFRISWILMEQCWFYFILSPAFSAGPQKEQNELVHNYVLYFLSLENVRVFFITKLRVIIVLNKILEIEMKF